MMDVSIKTLSVGVQVIIEDVTGPGTCICRTEEGRILEGKSFYMVLYRALGGFNYAW